MNYRQWKKKYKKEHGHNPPKEDCAITYVEADRIIEEFVNSFIKFMNEAVIPAARNFYEIIKAAAGVNGRRWTDADISNNNNNNMPDTDNLEQ